MTTAEESAGELQCEILQNMEKGEEIENTEKC